jgi:hypothetical protein
MKEQPTLIYQDLDGCLCNLDKATVEFYNGEFRDTTLYQNNKHIFVDVIVNTISELEDALGRSAVTEFLKVTPEKFWADMSWLPTGKALWDLVKEHDPIILSAPVDIPECMSGKLKWVEKNLGKDIRVILEMDKYKHVTDNLLVRDSERNKLRVLIDDSVSKITAWKKAGGMGILHESYTLTKIDLWSLGILEDL